MEIHTHLLQRTQMFRCLTHNHAIHLVIYTREKCSHNHKQIGTRLGEPYTAGLGQKRATQGLSFVGFTEWLEHSLSQGQGWGGGGESISVGPISLWLATELQLYLNTHTQKWREDTRMRHSTTTDYGEKWGAPHSFPTHTVSPQSPHGKGGPSSGNEL